MTQKKPKNVDKSHPKSHGRKGVATDPSLRGRGPAKGAPNAGRPPDEWKRALRALADRKAVLDHIDTALTNGPEDPFFAKALDYVTDHGYGRAAQPVEHSGTLGVVELLEAAHAKRDAKP